MFRLMQKRQYQQRQRGIVIVETVIILPIVLFLMLAVAELGNALLQYNVLTRAVRNSARYLVDEAEAGSSQVVALTAAKITAAQNIAAYGATGTGTSLLPGLAPGNITVSVVNTNNVLVAAQYQYQPLFAGGIPDVLGASTAGGVFTMNAQVVMRAL